MTATDNTARINKLAFTFVVSSGCIFLVTSLAKIISALGRANILNFGDPIFGISFRHVMLIMGIWELVISAICLFANNRKLQLFTISWLASCFLVYRFGLWFVGWTRPCPCLGGFYDAIHVSSGLANLINKSIIFYLLVGGYWLSGIFWRCQKTT
jgi:hypothetical protein